MKPRQPIQIMRAPDMFCPDLIQKFNKKTGERISYGHPEIEFEPEPVQEEPELVPNQLNLF